MQTVQSPEGSYEPSTLTIEEFLRVYNQLR